MYNMFGVNVKTDPPRRGDRLNMHEGGCSGCGRERRDGVEDCDLYLETCEDCGWSVCESCSCDEHRGQCKCLNSDMGNAYADMDGPKACMGSNGGPRYLGPFKCAAQRDMESKLMMDQLTGGKCLSECCFSRCGKALSPAQSKLCTRCRSAIYCSVECQRAAWTTPNGVIGAHKGECASYLPPESWPYISRDFRAYFEHWGRYPTAKPTAAEHAAAEILAEARQQQQDDDENRRQAYLRERDALLAESGLPTLAELMAAGEAPPQSPATPTPMEQDVETDAGAVQSRTHATAAARAAELLYLANPNAPQQQ